MAELTFEELRQLAVDAAKAANPTAKQEDLEAHIPRTDIPIPAPVVRVHEGNTQ